MTNNGSFRLGWWSMPRRVDCFDQGFDGLNCWSEQFKTCRAETKLVWGNALYCMGNFVKNQQCTSGICRTRIFTIHTPSQSVTVTVTRSCPRLLSSVDQCAGGPLKWMLWSQECRNPFHLIGVEGLTLILFHSNYKARTCCRAGWNELCSLACQTPADVPRTGGSHRNPSATTKTRRVQTFPPSNVSGGLPVEGRTLIKEDMCGKA